jgi:AcrR family transcriptional regulator
MMNPNDPRALRTREKVLEAAYELLTEIGFWNLTIEHISERSGVARSTIYRHWTTRDEILREAFSSLALSEALKDKPLLEALRHYARTVARGLRDSWGRAAATLSVSALDDPEQQKVQVEFMTALTADIATLLQRAKDAGELRKIPNPHEVAEQLFAPLFYRYLFSEQKLEDAFAVKQADQVYKHILETWS